MYFFGGKNSYSTGVKYLRFLTFKVLLAYCHTVVIPESKKRFSGLISKKSIKLRIISELCA